MGKYDSYKEDVLKYARLLHSRGYNIGTSGNVSILIEGEEALAVTPSGLDYEELTPADICIVNFDLSPLEGQYKPSVETAMHVSVYKNRRDVNAIMHTHQLYASIFSLINEPIPALFDDAVMNIGRVVEVVPYAVSGSPELAENVAAKLTNHCNCYILQNHGALALGTSIAQALKNVDYLEKCARDYYYAMTTGKKITTLPDTMAELIFEVCKAGQEKEIAKKQKEGK